MSKDAHHIHCQHEHYRMSCEDFDALYEVASGACQICRAPEAETGRGRLVIDHLPGYPQIAVRGLLCDRCNHMMGRIDSGKAVGDVRTSVYKRHAWFIRVLTGRRLATFPEHVRARHTTGLSITDIDSEPAA